MASSRKTLVELKRDLDSTYCYPGIIDSRSLVDFGKDTETWFSSITDQLKCQKDELTANTFNSSKVKKEMLGKWLERVVKLLERNEAIMMHLLGIVDKSKTDLIAAQQKVVKLQEELLVRKNEVLKTLQTTVTSTVQNTVQHEIRSYSEAVMSAPAKTTLCEDNLKTVVRNAIEDEDRSRNLIIHGMKEESGEQLSEKVSCLLEKLGEKPRVEVCRIGKGSTGTSIRPVKVVFSNSTSPKIILSKSKNLKVCDKYKEVYICPDRTAEERVIHKQLVQVLKKKRDEEPSRHHFIRNNQVCSVDRNDNSKKH